MRESFNRMMTNLGLYPTFMLHSGLGGLLNTVDGMARIPRVMYQTIRFSQVNYSAAQNENSC